jgi:hypothetical protein
VTDANFLEGVIGGAIGAGFTMFFTTLAAWRDDNSSRKKRRELSNLLIAELHHRERILRNRFADWDSDNLEWIADQIMYGNSQGSGDTFNFEEELKNYEFGLLALRGDLFGLSHTTVSMLYGHYQTMSERLIAHRKYVERREELKASEVLHRLRKDTSLLIERLRTEIRTSYHRLYHEWLFGL